MKGSLARLRSAVLVLTAFATALGCAHGGASGDAGSSAGSGQSSGQTGASGESSRQSSGSTGEESTETSSANSTRESSAATSQETRPILSVTAGATTLVGLGYLFWSALTKTAAAPVAAPAATAFLRANHRQLEQDLALGAGPAIEDLAAIGRIRRENLARFARALRSHRAELLRLSHPSTLTEARAVETFRRIGLIAAEDPALAEDSRRFLMREANPG